MKRVHVAIGVEDLSSISFYEEMAGVQAEFIIENEYALFRTESMNLSLRVVPREQQGVRHLGFEDASAESFSSVTDPSGVVWERFSEKDQMEEIHSIWPHVRKESK